MIFLFVLLGGAVGMLLGFIIGVLYEGLRWSANTRHPRLLEFEGRLFKVVEIHSPHSFSRARQAFGGQDPF